MLEDNDSIYKFNIETKVWSQVQVVSRGNKLTNDQITGILTRDSHSQFLCGADLYIFGGYKPLEGIYSDELVKISL